MEPQELSPERSPKIPYDLHENDIASWSCRALPAQRDRGTALTSPLGLGRRLRLGAGLHQVKQRLELARALARI